MDKEQLVRNAVYNLLSKHCQGDKLVVSYHKFKWHFFYEEGVELKKDDSIRTVLHEYIHELLIDRILMLVPSERSFLQRTDSGDQLLVFQITSYGAKCIREGILKPTSPNLHTLFDSLRLHAWVLEVSESHFKSGHYDSAILEAYKMIANKVKAKTGLESDGGQGLMGEVFKFPNQKLALNTLATESDKNEQNGFKLLFMGAMTGIRNPPAHNTQRARDPYETLHYLSFASILADKIENAVLNP